MTDTMIKLLLSAAVVVLVGPIDALPGIGGLPVLPEFTIAALFAIWGIEWNGNN